MCSAELVKRMYKRTFEIAPGDFKTVIVVESKGDLDDLVDQYHACYDELVEDLPE